MPEEFEGLQFRRGRAARVGLSAPSPSGHIMNTNTLSVLRAKLGPMGQQRLFEFLDVVDTDTAARFRGWLGSAPDSEVGAAADFLNRTAHSREFVNWWRSHDRGSAAPAPQSSVQPRQRTPLEHLHSQAHARSANRDLTVGGAWLVGGLLVTVVSYGLAVSSPGGGHFVIATGAMLYGALRLFRGLRAG